MAEVTRTATTSDLNEITARLEALIGNERTSEAFVRFRIDLLKAQRAVYAALAERAPTEQPSVHRRGNGDSRGGSSPEPALTPDAVAFDADRLKELLAALCAAAERYGERSEDMARLAAVAEHDEALLTTLARKTAFGPDREYLETRAVDWRVSVEALLFLGRALAAPFVAVAAQPYALSTAERSDRDATGTCPCCGSPPALAHLREPDGRRVLHCSLCSHEWSFRRLECPYCGCGDQQALKFLRTDEQNPRWIETCEQCKGYIKTVDDRQLPAGEPLIPLVEDADTLYLDLLAQKEGYLSGLPYTACC